MLNEPHKPDPLESYTFLTLFPRAFGHLRVPQDLDPLESVHIYLKSVALTSPQKLLEAAKTILEGAEQAENPKTLPFAAPSNSNLVTAKGEANCHVQRVPLAPKQDNVNSNPNIRMDVNHQKEPEYFSVHGKHEASENNDEAVAAIGKENHRDRRPGLGRKRARFSMNPNMSQPSINLEPTEDMYQLEDPEKYFAAFENLENAKREVQRQMGINSTNVKAKNLSSKTRSRRPGLLGRSVTFKHSYSSMLSEIVDIVTSPEETLHEDLQTSSNCDGDATNRNVLLEEKSLNRPSAKKKSRVDEVLDEVIYTNEDVDGDEALSQIQESLQIKPIDLDNLCLPKFHDIEISDIDTLGEKMPYNRESFKISMEKGFSIKSLLRDKETSDSLEDPLMSPTPAKSPFGSMSLLKRRLMQRSPLNDSFSFHDLEEQPPNNPSLGVPDQQLGNVDTSPSREEGTTNPTRTNVLCSDELLHENLGNIGFEVDAGANKSLADVENFDTGFHEDSKLLEDAEDMLHDASNGQPAINVEGSNGSHIILDDVKENGKSSVENFDTGFHEDSKLLDDAEDMLHDASNGQPAINIEGSNGSHIILDDVKENGKSSVEENLEDIYKEAAASGQPAANIEVSRMDNLNNESQMDELNSCVGHQLVQPSITPETSPVTQHKKPRTKIIAKRAHKGHCRIKVPSRRESLIDAGLLWNSGVRRSSRIKRKPLEYWKGERFLYGRVHGSLPTVIGVKYISPGKEGAANPTFRVQSFVSDEYKELVDLAALH